MEISARGFRSLSYLNYIFGSLAILNIFNVRGNERDIKDPAHSLNQTGGNLLTGPTLPDTSS